MATFTAYYRVSTVKQGQSGLGLEAQRATAQAFALSRGQIVEEFVEIESGKKNDRPKLIAAIAHSKATGSTLLIAKLDRLARNVAFIATMMDAGVDFVACDQPFASRLTLHILAAVAEDEARRISERTKAALAAAKARGTKLGSPIARQTVEKARAARSAYAADASTGTRQVIADIRASGVETLTGIAKALQARGIKTPRGNTTWQAAQVARLVA